MKISNIQQLKDIVKKSKTVGIQGKILYADLFDEDVEVVQYSIDNKLIEALKKSNEFTVEYDNMFMIIKLK